MHSSYDFALSPALQTTLAEIDSRKSAIDSARKSQPDRWIAIQEKLRIDWTYDSNAIEGSTLTRGETLFFLTEGLTVEGKPLKDFLDARNHAEAIDFLADVIKRRRDITPGLIKEINALLLRGITQTDAVSDAGERVKKPAVPGEYKQRPNHVLQQDGTIHYYVDPLQVPNEMEQLCGWIAGKDASLHPLITAATAHYNMVRIHPFDDGNGRGARILMNCILMKHGYPPAIIRIEQRREYLNALAAADAGDTGPFLTLAARSLCDTQQTILDELTR